MKAMLALCLVALAVIVGLAYRESGNPNFFFTDTYSQSMFDLLPHR